MIYYTLIFDLNLPFFHHFHARIRMLEIKFPFSIKSKIELFCLNLFWINSQKVYGFIKMTLLFKSILKLCFRIKTSIPVIV